MEYRDFNLCRPGYFDPLKNDYFEDEHHLNKNGSDAFSKLFCDYYNGLINDVDLFYESYSEKAENLEYDILGAVVKKEDDSIIIEPVTRDGSWDDISCQVKITGSDETEGYGNLTVKPGEKVKVGSEYSGDIEIELSDGEDIAGHIEITY